MSDLTAYSGLFFTAFIAATILPLQSEALLSALLLTTDLWPWLLITIASIGNIAGSCVNWGLGRSIERLKDKKWFPVSPKTLIQAETYYKRYGVWSLLLAWVPLIGDPITVAAGVMRTKFLLFLLLVSLSKTGRYLVLLYLIMKFKTL